MNKRRKYRADLYPDWICEDCATAAGAVWPEGHVCTTHTGQCEVCNRIKTVTEPRDWGYPDVRIGDYDND